MKPWPLLSRAHVRVFLAALACLGAGCSERGDLADVATFERRYTIQLQAMRDLAADSLRYNAEGMAWDHWQMNQGRVFTSEKIVAASVCPRDAPAKLFGDVPQLFQVKQTIFKFSFPVCGNPPEEKAVVEAGTCEALHKTVPVLRYRKIVPGWGQVPYIEELIVAR